MTQQMYQDLEQQFNEIFNIIQIYVDVLIVSTVLGRNMSVTECQMSQNYTYGFDNENYTYLSNETYSSCLSNETYHYNVTAYGNFNFNNDECFLTGAYGFYFNYNSC